MDQQPSKMTAEQEAYNNTLFKNLIPIYDTVAFFLGPVRQRILADLNDYTPKPVTVLDVACGTGTQAVLLAEHGFQLTGIDLSKEMLDVARSKMSFNHPVTLIQGDATQMPFADNTFDASTISFGLHDLPEEIRVPVLKEMARVTKKNGPILVADYATPADGFLAHLERPISNLFESKYFDSFMEKGLNYYLDEAGLVKQSESKLMVGIAQLVICLKK